MNVLWTRVRSTSFLLLLLTATSGFVAPATADAEVWQAWLVGGGGIVWPPSAFSDDLTHSGTIGGILGIRLTGPWAVELRAHDTYRVGATDPYGGYNHYQISHGELNLTRQLMPDAPISPYLTAGAGEAEDEFAWNVGAGFRIRIINRVSLRIDGRDVSYRANVCDAPGQCVLKFVHAPEVFGGFSFGFGTREPAKR